MKTSTDLVGPLSLIAWCSVVIVCWTTCCSANLLIVNSPTDITPSNLATTCLQTIPVAIRNSCQQEAVNKYTQTRYKQKRVCCTRWTHIECLKRYAFNSIYCNFHQQAAVHKYFQAILATASQECFLYPPAQPQYLDSLGPLLEGRSDGEACIPRGFE